MKLKRAVLCGILLWVIIFFEISILMFGLNLAQPVLYYIHYAVLILLAGFVSHFYFRGNGVRKGAGEGFMLGVIFVVVGKILDAVITVPLFIGSYSFFADIFLWIGIVETVVITTVAGAVKK